MEYYFSFDFSKTIKKNVKTIHSLQATHKQRGLGHMPEFSQPCIALLSKISVC